MVWNNYNIISNPLFLARSQSSSDENWPISHRLVFAPQSTRSFYCRPWSLHHCLITYPPSLQSMTIFYSWDSPFLSFPKLPGLSPSIPIHLSLSPLVSVLFSSVPLVGHTLAASSPLLGLKNHILPSLWRLNPLLMVHSSQNLVIFISPHHSLFFLKYAVFSTQSLLCIFLMLFMTNMVILSYPGALAQRSCSALVMAQGNNFS